MPEFPESLFHGAMWIASSVTGGTHVVPPAPYFRKTFSISKPIQYAQLRVTALGLYEIEINGKRVGDQVFAPGWTEYSKRVQYQVYDLCKFLHRGENALGAILGEGWYCGAIGWDLLRQNYGTRPQLLVRLEIGFKDGETLVVTTDKTWKTAVGPILENDFLKGESHDARLELGNWSQASYDDAGWTSVVPAADPKIEFNLSDAPPVRRIGALRSGRPRLLSRHGNEIRIYDFGQNFSGRVRIAVKAKGGVTLTLRFAEILQPDGHLYTENLRGALATDHYTCKGEGLEMWEPKFTFHGFRYVEVYGLNPEMSLKMTGVVLHSDLKPTGYFSCSNPLLNQLQSNIVWSQKGNFLEVPTDCPQRDERLGWTGDAQVFIRTAAFNMDVRGFFNKWMRDIRDAQGPRGGISAIVPKFEKLANWEDGGPGWSDATVICPWTIYLCYGDRKILEDHYESMVRFLEFTGKKRSVHYIRCHPGAERSDCFGDWLALDGGGKLEGVTPKDLIGTAFYAHSVDLMVRIAVILGKMKDAETYRRLHGKIVAAFRRRFISKEGVIMAGTQTAHVLALHFNLVPESLKAVVAGALAKLVEERGFHLATGFIGTPYILDVLEDHGHLDVAYKLLEQENFPSWLFPVKNGATTIWERWDGWTPEKGPQDKGMNSYNHYAYGAVGAWMVRSVAGIDLDEEKPGYRHIIFRPQPGGSLKWAEARLQIEQGEIRIRWEKTGKNLKLDLTVPPRHRASLKPPLGYGKIRSLPPGRHRLVLGLAGNKKKLKKR